MEVTRVIFCIVSMFLIWQFLIPYTFNNIHSYNLSSALFAIESGVIIVMLVYIMKVAFKFSLGLVHAS